MAKKAKAKKSGGLPKSFIYALIFLVIIPVTLFLGWYVLTVVLQVSGSQMTAESMVAEQVKKAQQAVKNQIVERAKKENFQVDNFEACTQIDDQYRLPIGYVYTEFTQKQLLGLPADATEDQMRERCVVFAKVVSEMEKLAHHDRHVFVCQGAEFATDESGQYVMVPDPKGRGVIQRVNNQQKLTPIPRGSHTLIRSWQVYNLGDGCIVVGMSKSGVFSMSGAVKMSQ
ncbi:MAG: hypothetical protein RIC16_00715 [Rhodospirillales bacterium]